MKKKERLFFVCVCMPCVWGLTLTTTMRFLTMQRGPPLRVSSMRNWKWRLWVGIKRVSELVGTIEIDINLKEGWWWWVLCCAKRREE